MSPFSQRQFGYAARSPVDRKVPGRTVDVIEAHEAVAVHVADDPRRRQRDFEHLLVLLVIVTGKLRGVNRWRRN